MLPNIIILIVASMLGLIWISGTFIITKPPRYSGGCSNSYLDSFLSWSLSFGRLLLAEVLFSFAVEGCEKSLF